MTAGLAMLDWVVVAIYFAAIVAIVYFTSRKQETASDYFLASRDVGFLAVGATLFSTNIGSEHIVGLAGNGATSGMGMAHWELHAWVMVLLAWVFLPFYYRAGVFTIPEFLERRFNATARGILSTVSLVAYVFTKVSVTVYAGGMVFGVLLADTFGSVQTAFWAGAFITVILTGIYTIFGGLRAVVYTDAAQAYILILGSACITFFGLSELGGWQPMKEIISQNAQQFALWRPNSDPDFPWLGILIASPIVGIWYWCTDQYIVQKALTAKDLKNARRGALWGGFLKVWPVLIFIIPGMMGYALHQKGIIHIPLKPDGSIQGDQVFPVMVSQLLPVGLRGLVVAGLLAALMSSLASLFNSCASLFTVDIYQKLYPTDNQKKLVTVGRIATGVVVVLGIMWIPIMPAISKGGLYQYLQSVQSYLAPPITAVFLLGLFFKRINGTGAVAGLAIGFALGMLKLSIQALVGSEMITGPDWLVFLGKYNFLFFSGWLLAISIVVVVVASLLTPAQDPATIKDLTYDTISQAYKDDIRASWNKWDVIGTVVVLGCVVGMYLYFSFWL